MVIFGRVRAANNSQGEADYTRPSWPYLVSKEPNDRSRPTVRQSHTRVQGTELSVMWCASAWRRVVQHRTTCPNHLGCCRPGMSKGATTPEGRARISAAQKRRWARWREAKLVNGFLAFGYITIHYVSTSSAGSVCANRSSLFRCHRGLATKVGGYHPPTCLLLKTSRGIPVLRPALAVTRSA